MIDKTTLEKHKKNKREIVLLDKQIARLYDSLDRVPVVSGKVTASSQTFPYIEQHVTVEMTEPREAARIRGRIKEKEDRKKVILEEIKEVELFIQRMPEGIVKRIFELAYMEDMKQWEIADIVGYSRGRISQIIGGCLKD